MQNKKLQRFEEIYNIYLYIFNSIISLPCEKKKNPSYISHLLAVHKFFVLRKSTTTKLCFLPCIVRKTWFATLINDMILSFTETHVKIVDLEKNEKTVKNTTSNYLSAPVST